MAHTKFVALFFLLACAVVQANQCSRVGGCPSDGESQNSVSLLQTKLQTDAIEDVEKRAAASDLDVLPSFTSFIQQYGRTYRSDTKEYKLRQNLYEKRLKEVHQQSSQPDRLWNAVVNRLTDRTEGELSQLRGLRLIQPSGKAPGVGGTHRSGQSLSQVRTVTIEEEKSWAHLDAVQQHVDQGGCGSCWAFATAMMLQANAEIHGLSRTFSPQELVDCVPNPNSCGGEGGCEGATVELAMNWVMANSLETESTTPYNAVDGSCKKSSLLGNDAYDNQTLAQMIAVGFHPANNQSLFTGFEKLAGWHRLEENKYDPLITAVATKGPVAVSVGANQWSWYGGGVFDGCTDFSINHAVVLIGYGNHNHTTKGKTGYWLIKNSWGNDWGENGKIRLLREEGVKGDNAHCGTDHVPKEGTGCDDAPDTVPVCGMCGILYDNVVPHFSQWNP